MSEYNNIAGYKISIQKSTAFLYIALNCPKMKLRKQCYLKQHQKECNSQELISKRDIDFHSENCKTLLKEIKGDLKMK